MKKLKIMGILLISLMFVGVVNAETTTCESTNSAMCVSNETDLKTALDEGKNVLLTADIELESTMVLSGKGNITIESFGDKIYTVSNSKSKKTFEVHSSSSEELLTLTFENVKITNGYKDGRCIDTRTGNIDLTLENIELTAEVINSQPITVGGNYTGTNKITVNNSTISAGGSGYGIITFNKVDLSINNSKINGYAALYFKEANSSAGSNGSTIVVKNSELVSETDTDEPSNSFATIAYSDKNIKVEVIDSLIKAVSKGKTPQYITGASCVLDDSISLIISGNSEIVVDTTEEIAGFYTKEENDFSTEVVEIKEGVTANVDIKDYVKTGNRVVKESGKYVVYKENAISLYTVTNGTVTVDKTTAIVGETITVNATANAGFILENITVVDADNKEVTVTDGKFTMPNSAVTVTVEFVEIKHKAEITPVVPTEEVKEVVVGVTETEKTEEVLLDSLNEALENDKDLSELLANTSASVSVEITALEEKDIEEEIKDIEKEAGKATVATYFDIAVLIKDNGDEIGSLTKLTKEIELVVLLPEDLKNEDKKVTRKYYVIRRHVNEDGTVEVEKLDATLSKDGKSLTFKTDKFSTYALAYEDVANENPKTLDNIGIYIILGTLSLVAFASVVVYRKKRYN